MAKKPKTLEVKLRSAIRLIWSRSAERRAIIKESTCKAQGAEPFFHCAICTKAWPIWAGEVDHEPPIGTLERWQDVGEFINKMFFGPQRVVCKTCHKKKTAEQRRKK
jgi:hypothetical protein